jgi:hypothetical protein
VQSGSNGKEAVALSTVDNGIVTENPGQNGQPVATSRKKF